MKNRAIITSALPYANGEIHLGHVASTYIPADVTTRFLRLKGVEAYYVCASDDYGTPILVQYAKYNHQRRTRNTPLLPLVSKTVLLHQLGYRWMPHAPNVSRHLHMAKR